MRVIRLKDEELGRRARVAAYDASWGMINIKLQFKTWFWWWTVRERTVWAHDRNNHVSIEETMDHAITGLIKKYKEDQALLEEKLKYLRGDDGHGTLA